MYIHSFSKNRCKQTKFSKIIYILFAYSFNIVNPEQKNSLYISIEIAYVLYMKVREKTKEKNRKLRSYTNTRKMNLPEKFKPNFLTAMDKRTEIYQAINKTLTECCNDMGGKESLSTVQVTLVERFCFLSFVVRNIEYAILTRPKEIDMLLPKYLSVSNVIRQLATTLGLQRQAKQVLSLESYVKKNKSRKKGKS